MAVLPTKTEHRCKICRHPERFAIDALLELRSTRARNPDGSTVNLAYVLEQMSALGVENPTAENVKLHWKNHCTYVRDEDVGVVDGVAGEIEEMARSLGAEFEEDGAANADTLPDRAIRVFDLYLTSELKRGRMPKITWDQVRAMIDTKTRRRQNERITDLLDLAAHASTVALGLYEQPAELGSEEIEDAVFEELPRGEDEL